MEHPKHINKSQIKTRLPKRDIESEKRKWGKEEKLFSSLLAVAARPSGKGKSEKG
jgi:hypothetical protein